MLAVVLLHGAARITPKVEIPTIELRTAKALAPVTTVNVIGLVFNILCLRGVEASFFQVPNLPPLVYVSTDPPCPQIARGLVLPLTIMVSSIHGRSLPSLRVIFAAAIVSFGFFVGVSPDSAARSWREAPSQMSIIYGVLSSLFIAIHAVLIKYSLPFAQNSTIQLAYWQNLGSAIMLAPFILFQGELAKLAELYHNPNWNAEVFVWGSLITGVFGFLLCVAGLLSIKVTSPVTHMFSSVSSVLCHPMHVAADTVPAFHLPSAAIATSILLRHLGGPLCHPDAPWRLVIQRLTHEVSSPLICFTSPFHFCLHLISVPPMVFCACLSFSMI